MLTRNNSRPAIPSLPAARLAPFPSRLPLSFSLSPSSPEHAYIYSPSPLPSSRSRGVSTRILVNTVGFSFHVGVRMLLEDITTGLACLTRFDATSLSVSLARPLARSFARPLVLAFLAITRTPATSVCIYCWNFALETATLVAIEQTCPPFRFICPSLASTKYSI